MEQTKIVSFTVQWTCGAKTEISSPDTDTLREALANTVDFDNFNIKLFYKGKEIPTEMTLRGSDIRKGSTIIVLQKKKIVYLRQHCIDKTQTNVKHTTKKSILQSESAKGTDTFFNALEINPKCEIIYQKTLFIEKKDQMNDDKKEDEHKTIIDYIPTISEKPLEFKFHEDEAIVPKTIKKDNHCRPYTRATRRSSFEF